MATKTPMSDNQMEQVTQTTGQALAEQPKRLIRLFQHAPGSGEKPLPAQVVGINGYNYVIPRGMDVEVPESVVDVLRHAGHI